MHRYYLIYIGLLSDKNRNRIPSKYKSPSAPSNLAHFLDKVCDYRCQESGGCEVQYIGSISSKNKTEISLIKFKVLQEEVTPWDPASQHYLEELVMEPLQNVKLVIQRFSVKRKGQNMKIMIQKIEEATPQMLIS